MATTNIDINKLTVEQFLSTGKEHLFIIPEYQRPYAWDEEQTQTLFSDLKDFAERDMSKNDKQMYFLGCIVSYINTLVAGLVDFGQVLEQCTLHHIVGVKDFTVFFQIVTAQTSVFADLIIAVIRQNKVRDEIIAHLTIYAALQNRQLSEEDRIQMQFENSSSLVQL